MMTYTKLTLSLYVLVIALWGCANVDQQPFEEGSAATTKLTVNLPVTKATADTPANESVVHRARVIVVASEGTTREGKVTGNMLFDNLQGLKLEALALSGISDIYVLANERPDQTEALNKIASLQQLKNALVRFEPLPAGTSAYDDLPMMALISNVTIDLDSKKNIFSATLKRLWAKFNICFKAEGEYIDQVQLTSIELQSLPKYSYWLDGHAYPETNFTKGTKTELNGSEGLLISADPTQSFVFYAPEYLVTDPDAHTRLIVRGYKKDVPSTLCVYRIALGHNPSPESEDEAVDYNIRRNTRYNMTGIIKGYGGGDVDVEMTVNEWHETVEMGDEQGEYFYVPQTEWEIDYGDIEFKIDVKSNTYWDTDIVSGSTVNDIKVTGDAIIVGLNANRTNQDLTHVISVSRTLSGQKNEKLIVITQKRPYIVLGGRLQVCSENLGPGTYANYDYFTATGNPLSRKPPVFMGSLLEGCNTIDGVGQGWRLPTSKEFIDLIFPNNAAIIAQGGMTMNHEGMFNRYMTCNVLYFTMTDQHGLVMAIYPGDSTPPRVQSEYSPRGQYLGLFGSVRCVRDI